MEALLPSEVARLVLGYLEEEKCEPAAKCFLDSSPHLNEYRSLALQRKKYPTKVNGYSLKEVLDEYCLVHSIVQECLSSMNEQPSVGGSMIDNLQFLVRACQPVQVHINLHPGQGQSCLSKLDGSDFTPGSTRTRSRKVTLNTEHTSENSEFPTKSQSVNSSSMHDVPGYSTTLPENSAVQKIGINTDNQVLSEQTHLLQPHIVIVGETQNSQQRQNVTESGLFNSSESVLSINQENASIPQEQSCQDLHQEPQDGFQDVNLHQESSHLVPVHSFPQPSAVSKDFQYQLQMSNFHTNSGELASSQNNVSTQPALNNTSLPLVSENGLRNVTKPEEPVRSFTVTKCFGSDIVIMDSDSISQSSISTSGFLQQPNIQGNNDLKQSNSRSKPITPSKNSIEPEVVCEKIRQKMLEDVNNTMITKLVENINRVWTPGKKTGSDEPQTLGEGPGPGPGPPDSQGPPDLDDATVHSILKETEQDPVFEQFLHEFLSFNGSSSDVDDISGAKEGKKKKRILKKKSTLGGSKTMPELPTEAEADSHSSYQLTGSFVGTKTNSSMPMGLTPAKVSVEHDTMTPMTKLLKSITSPSGDLYLDPTQFAGLIDLPESATKIRVDDISAQEIPKESQPVQTDNGMMLQLPQPNGTTLNLPILVCSSNQQVAQYINEKGVNTIFTGEIQVMPQHGSYKPIVPKLCIGQPIPKALLQSTDSKPQVKNRPPSKRVLTRGGRRAAGQSRQDPLASKSSDNKNTVTMYSADGQDAASSTITVSNSADLPLLVPDTAELEVKLNSPERRKDISDPGSLSEANQCLSTQTECQNVNPETIAESTSKEEDKNNLPTITAAAIRNTPGHTRIARPRDKRQSFSTPRRRLSHIRALDFNTPPKENEQSFRKANTSPKNASTNALSPNTTGKSSKSKSCVREGLFKLPADGSRRTSKVKAHLFKSPDYPMGSSSGYKIPSAAVTSTPSDQNCTERTSPLPKTSSAWDEVGGVKLILDSDVSPVKCPPSKKDGFKSWDADLRSLLGSSKEQSSSSSCLSKRKSKIPPPSQKKIVKKSKKSQDKKVTQNDLSKGEEILDNSKNASTESECEVAKMIEQNLMDISSDISHNDVSSDARENPTKLNSSNSSKTEIQDIEDNIKAYCIEKDPVGEKHERTDTISDESSTSVAPSKIDSEEKSLEGCSDAGQFENCESAGSSGMNALVLNTQQDPCGNENVKISEKQDAAICERGEQACSEDFPAAAENCHLSQVAWKESFSFSTPMKEDFGNIIPQTPRFLSPNSRTTEDTPHTKIIKSLPFPVVPCVENSVPTLTVPPTPTIRTTPSVSPNGPAYFQPIDLPPSEASLNQNSSIVKNDTLENVLIQECSRIEADGMRESVKISARKLQKELIQPKPSGSEECCTTEQREPENVVKIAESDKSMSKDSNVKSGLITAHSACKSESKDHRGNGGGCARLVSYERKGLQLNQLNNRHDLNIGNIHLDRIKHTPQRTPSSGDESDLMISVTSSPGQSSVEEKKTTTNSVLKSCNTKDQQEFAGQRKKRPGIVKSSQDSDLKTQAGEKKKVQEHVPKTCEIPDLNPSTKSDTIKVVDNVRPPSPMSAFQVANIRGVEIEEALDKLHNKKAVPRRHVESVSKTSRSELKMPLSPVILTSLEQTQTAAGKLDNLLNNARSQPTDNSPMKTKSPMMLSTPAKTKSLAVNEKAPSSKKKSDSSKDIQKEVSEDESSESSSDSSSSGSDSDTSSSSSSEEGTPVKENVSPGKLNTPLKTRSGKASEKKQQKEEIVPRAESVQNAEALNLPQSEFESSVKANNLNENVESTASLLSVEERTSALAINLLLSSLVETPNSISKYEKSLKIRSAHNLKKPPILSELQQKLERVKQQMKPKEYVGNKLKDSKKTQVSPENSKTRSSMTKVVSEVIETTEVHEVQVIQHETKELSTKRRSKSENEKVETDFSSKDRSAKPRSASDSACRVSDEDEEFKLHLSGDEKEEPPSKSPSETHDTVELQIAALHGDLRYIDKNQSVKLPNVTKESTHTEENNILENCKSKSEPKKTSDVNLPSTKVSSKCSISSETADKVLRNVLEKGLGCSLPPPPNQKLKKIPRTSDKLKLEPKSGDKLSSQALQDVKGNSSSNAESSPHSEQMPLNGNSEELNHELDDDEPMTEEILNSSSNNSMLLVNVIYKGLGSSKPKKDNICLKSQKMFFDEGFVLLSPSTFFTFKDNITSKNKSDEDVCERKIPNSDISRPKNCKISKTDGKRRMSDSDDRGDTRIPKSAGRSSNERGARYRNESRLRRNRSPSPKYRRGSDYSLDYDNHHRDYLRGQDYRSRSKRYNHSSGRMKSSDSESKSHDPSAPQTQAAETKVAEEGEILSSDCDLEAKHTNKSQRKSSPARARRISNRESKTTAGRETWISQRRKRLSSPPKWHDSRRSSGVRYRTCLRSSPDRKRDASRRLTKAEEPPVERNARQSRKPVTPDRGSHVMDEDINDADLDNDMDFPVLGDDRTEEENVNNSKENTRHVDDQVSHITRRRAPPRSVNAHKTTPSDLKTPVQKGKRKLSASPEEVSEDGCQSSLGSVNTEKKQLGISQRSSRKLSNCIAPANKISRTSKGENVADSTDIIKNLDVESFLVKIHGQDC